MFHPWQQYVLGGVQNPQIYFVEENLIANPNAEDSDISGYFAGELDLTRTTEGETFYGDYCFKVDNLTGVYVDRFGPLYYSEPGEKYLISFFAKNGRNLREKILFLIYFPDGSYDAECFYIGPEWEQFSFIYEIPYSTDAADDERIYIYPLSPMDDSYPDVVQYYDNFHCHKIIEHYELAEPQIYSQNFEKLKYAENEMIDGSLREYIKGWRYNAKLTYEFENALQEKIRTKISNGENMFFFPHKDSNFCQKVMWDSKEYRRDYFGNKYLGYKADIELIGVELLGKQPTDIVGIGGYAIDDLSEPVIS